MARKSAFTQMLADLKDKKPELIEEHASLEETYENSTEKQSVKVSQLMKLR